MRNNALPSSRRTRQHNQHRRADLRARVHQLEAHQLAVVDDLFTTYAAEEQLQRENAGLAAKLEVVGDLLIQARAERDKARRAADRAVDDLLHPPEFPVAADPALTGQPCRDGGRCYCAGAG